MRIWRLRPFLNETDSFVEFDDFLPDLHHFLAYFDFNLILSTSTHLLDMPESLTLENLPKDNLVEKNSRLNEIKSNRSS